MCFHVSATLSDGASAFDDAAGTWKHIFVPSTSATDSYSIPLHTTTNPTNPEAREVPDYAEVQEPPEWFLPSGASCRHGVICNKQRGCQRTPCLKNYANKCENKAGIVRQRFSASWRCWRRSGAYMCPVSIAPTPRESNGTSWRVSAWYVGWKW